MRDENLSREYIKKGFLEFISKKEYIRKHKKHILEIERILLISIY